MSDATEVPEIPEVIKLAKLLRQNGDKILNATSKLSLSTLLLHNLNEVFTLVVTENEDIESSFQVCNNTKNDVYRDYKFLHDFVQKTISLKIIQDPSHPILHIDISKFRHLRYLELQKVCVEYLKGLQGIRGQLECVISSGGKGVSSLDCFLAKCGGDAGISFVWSSLIKLSLCYNNLTCLDSSLELTPWLQTLDLSHNLITKANELECLPNLKYLNLGYNKLESVPVFHKTACQTLQKLVLKNNYIDNISGLQGLENLTELDLSYNCLMDHCVLWPLEIMSTLMWVSLEGNPISYLPHHRLYSIKHLHPSISNTKFVLDRLPLSKSERQMLSENRIFTMRSVRTTSKSNLMNLKSSSHSGSAASSINLTSYFDDSAHSQMTDSMKSIEDIPTRTRRRNLKEAVINDFDHEDNEDFMSKSVNLTSSYKASSEDHLETKRQIRALREKFGQNNWLSSQGGTIVQNIMGLPSESKILSSSFKERTLEDALISDTPLINTQTNLENSLPDEVEKLNDSLIERVDNTEVNESAHVIPEVAYDPDAEQGDLYMVQKQKNKDSLEDIFLILTNEDITERDSITGKVKCRWATNSILSCVMGRDESTTIDINFDTSRRDRQSRRYTADLEDAKKIVSTLNEIITAKPILLKVYKCMKCSTHFSQDSDESNIITTISDNRQLKCPTCHSNLVIQTDELNMPLDENKPATDVKKSSSETSPNQTLEPSEVKLQHSASQSSIGSATSLEDSRESTPASVHAKKYESDIEILSNPSQSSIEVLDEGSRSNSTPKRKRSSEERRIALAPSLLTIPDTIPVMTGLTESSSSGSLTDSVCTTYENKASKLSEISEVTDSSSDSEKNKFGTVLNSEKEFLQSVKSGIYSFKKLDEGSESKKDIQYSYTDFKNVDHRIKLHIILNIFEHENEVLILLLRTEIMKPGSTTTFPGILILSTTKIYILKIDGSEGEDPQQWLKKDVSWTIDRLRSFAPLPFKQGVLVEIELPIKLGEEPNHVFILCLLQDFQRTSNLLLYLTDTPIPENCEVECSVPTQCNDAIKDVLRCSRNYKESDSVQILAILETAKLQFDSNSTNLQISALIVTSSAIVILADEMQWLLPESKQKPKIVTEQAMNNLVDINFQERVLVLNFKDSVECEKETWTLGFVSRNAAEAVIDSIRAPWERLFSKPMQINL